MCWISIAASLTFFTLSAVAALFQQYDFNAASARGLVIPDVVNITITFDKLWDEGKLHKADNQFIVISLLYAWTWLLHPSLCFLVNTILIALSINTFQGIIRLHRNMPNWMALGILLNPYLILAMPGPNKEIPLLLLTTLYISVIADQKKWWFLQSAILSLAVFAIRDGYGIFLLLSLILITATRQRASLFAPLLCTLLAVAATMYGFLDSLIPAFSRNRELFEAISTDKATGLITLAHNLNPYTPVDGAILFGFRLIHNIASLAVFPVVSTSEHYVYWLGLAYWINGIVIFSLVPTIALNTLRIKTASIQQSLIGGLVVGTWFMISVSLFVQPRYFMPIIPFALLAVAWVPPKLRYFGIASSIILTLGIIAGNASLGRSPAPATLDLFEPPGYIW